MSSMMKNRVQFLVLSGLFLFTSSAFAGLPNHPLIDLAKQDHGNRVQYAIDNGAETHLTSDGKSYYVLWFPEGSGSDNLSPMVATIHGHDGCAFVDFYVWHHFLKERGYGFLAVQWWLGEGEGIKDYLAPDEIYRAIDEVFTKLQVKPGTALLHGFSRGSANIYAVAAMDRRPSSITTC